MEIVTFPEWGIRRMKAKVDTGARTSALHVEELEEESGGRIRFKIAYGSRRDPKFKELTVTPLHWAKVRSSTGEYSTRPFVDATVQIGPVEKKIELSLVSREKMLFRMLLGRKALEPDFLVDVSRRYVFSRNESSGSTLPKTKS